MQLIIRGEYKLQSAKELIREKGYDAVFLVTGKHFTRDNSLDFLEGLNVRHFLKQGTNVTVPEIELAATLFEKEKNRAMMAVGGGSVIDLAKAVIHKLNQQPFFLAVPTTAGSGSEATAFAVIYEDKKKLSLVHDSLLPAAVILDPVLTYSLSNYQMASSGMDAFSQAVESFWNVNATSVSKEFAGKVIGMWDKHFINAVNGDRMARAAMLEAAHFSGKAIAITRTTGAHAMSYYVTANHNIAHGHAVALFLPLFFLYNQPSQELLSILGVTDPSEAIKKIQERMTAAGLATTFKDLGIDKNAVIDSLLEDVNQERFANNPEPYHRDKLKKLVLSQL